MEELLLTLKKNTGDYRMVRDCLIMNLVWVKKAPLPNVAEMVGVSLKTVKNLMTEVSKPLGFEKKCDKWEVKREKEICHCRYIKKAVVES